MNQKTRSEEKPLVWFYITDLGEMSMRYFPYLSVQKRGLPVLWAHQQSHSWSFKATLDIHMYKTDAWKKYVGKCFEMHWFLHKASHTYRVSPAEICTNEDETFLLFFETWMGSVVAVDSVPLWSVLGIDRHEHLSKRGKENVDQTWGLLKPLLPHREMRMLSSFSCTKIGPWKWLII